MKYALIGCGRIAMNHIKAAVNNKLKIVAVCDIVPEKMEELLTVLATCCPTVDFTTRDHLMSEKVLDSMDIVTIISNLEAKYDIDIEFEMITAENFDSAGRIYEMVKHLKKS